MNAPVATPETAIAVIDPKSYAAWDPLLDLFDKIRAETPVLRIESPTDDHAPFWLITRHEDVMRISKDNTTFLNSPRPTVLTNRAGEALAREITGGSPNFVQSLVALDAPKHPKLRRLTQEWFMPKNLKLIEADIRDLAKRTVDRLIAAGPEADFVPLVSAPYPLHVVMQILGVPEEDEPRMLFLTQQMFGGQDEDLNKTGMANLSPEQISQIVLGAVKDFTEYFEKLAEDRRQNPGKDVATILATGTIDGKPLDPLDLATGGQPLLAAVRGGPHAIARPEFYGWSLLYQLPGDGDLARVDPHESLADLPAFYESPLELADRQAFGGLVAPAARAAGRDLEVVPG